MARTVDTQGFEGLAPGRLGPLVLEAEGNADGLMLPRAFNLGGADYSRSGSDLVIIDPDGDEALIHDYFLSDPPPPLLTESGASFDGALIARLAGPRAPGQMAQAGAGTEAQPIGRIDAVEGTVTITRADGTQVTAGIGEPVFQGDVIETTVDGVIGIVFVDDTTFSLGAEGRMVLDELIYDPETQSGASTFSLVQGVFSFVSGKIAKTGVDAMEIRTPVATIGIRGTAGSIDLPEGEQLTVVLTQEPDGNIGEITVFNSAGVQVLNTPFDATQVTGFNAPPSGTFTMTVGEYNQRFAQAVNALPQNNQFNQNQQDNQQDQDNDEAGPPAPGDDPNEEGNPEGGEEGEAPLEEGELPPEEGDVLDEEAGPPLDGEGELGEEDPDASLDGEQVDGEELAGPPAPGEGEVAGPGLPGSGPQDDQTSFGPDVAGSEDDPFQDDDVFEVSNSGITGPTGTTGGLGDVGLGGGFGTGSDGLGSSGSQSGSDDNNDDIIIPVGSTGSGSVNSIVGTSGPDLLNGTAGSDVITGGAGDDTVFAGAGNDTIIGGTGNGFDTYDGGDGEDWLYYPSASSGITVDLGNGSASGAEIDTDTLYNVEHVLGGSGDDTLWGSSADNSLLGGAGNDTLDGGAGNDTLIGGAGFDIAYYSSVSGPITVDLSSGTATGAVGNDTLSGIEAVLGGSYDDSITGDSGGNSLNGGGGNDYLDGGAGDDTLTGGSGNDTLVAGAGNDTVSGGSGTQDVLDLSDATSGVTFDLGDTSAQAVGGGLDTITQQFADIEHLKGSDYDDSLIGSTLGGNDDNFIDGGAGNDTISAGNGINTLAGGAGNDVLTGGANSDTLDGGSGNDTLNGGSGNDTLLGAAGDDSLAGSAGSDFLDGGAGNDSLDGGSGNDTLQGGGGDDSLAGAAGGDTLDGEAGDDWLDAGAGDDTLNGGAGNDNLVGGAGNDTLEGGAGNDSLAGGTGDDNYVYTGGNDTLVEAGGNDTLSIASGQTVTDAYKDGTNIFLVMASGATVTLKDFYAGGGAIEKLDYATLSKIYTIVTGNTGGSADEMIAGTSGDETFNGNGGDDLVFAHGGNDTITASAGNDTYYGGAGNDTIDYSFITSGITADLSSGVITGLGSDHVSSVEHVVTGDGNDILTGDSADNRLYGNNGNDYLDGGAGNDTLIGGADDDSYVYSGGNDTIIDSSGNDTVKLGASDTIQNASTNGTDLFITLQSGDTITVSQHYSGSKDVEKLDYTSLSKTYTIQADDSGGAGNDLVAGSDSDDNITTGSGDDLVFANGGNDTITAGAGNDTYYGGAGDDTIVYSFITSGITADLSSGIITGLGSDLVNSVEHVVGSGGNDKLTGNSGNNRLFGDNGNDTLVGGAGDDTLDGGNDNDLADYSAATAGVTVDLSSGQASGGAGNDSLLNIENVLGSNFDDTLVADASSHLLGGNGNDLLTTSADNSDTFEGGAGNDTLQSGSGTDTLVGGAGDDLLQGGADDDSYLYNLGDGNDTIDDTAGSTDTLILDASTSFDSAARVGDNLVLTVNGGATIVIKDHYNGQPLESLDVGALSTVYNILTGLTGSPSNELIVSGTSGDVMSGGSGNDYMFGGGGNDQVSGDNGNDRIYGGAGDDTVSGGSGNDTVYGDSGNDYVAGGAGTDTLFGGTGNDTVAGGAGSDLIYLGAGNDTVYYDAVSHIGDTIMDFDPTNDVFSFNGTDFGALLGGSISATNFVSTTNLPSGSDGLASTPTFIFFDNPSGNDALYYDEDGLLGGFTVTKVAEFNGSLSGFDHNNIAIASGQA